MRLFVGPYYLASIQIYTPTQTDAIARAGVEEELEDQNAVLGGHILPLELPPGRTDLLMAVKAPGIAQISVDVLESTESAFATGGRTIGIAFHLGILTALTCLSMIPVALRPGPVSNRLFLFNALILLQVAIGSGALVQMLPNLPTEPAMTVFVMVVLLRVAVWGWLYQAIIEPVLGSGFYRLACQISYFLAAVGIGLYALDWLIPARGLTLSLVLGIPIIHVIAAFRAREMLGALRFALIGSLVIYEILQIAAIVVVTTESGQSDLPILLLRLTDILIPLLAMGAVVLRNRQSDEKLAHAQQEVARQEARLAAETSAKEEKRTLIDMLAHEIRNPLATLQFASSGISRHIDQANSDARRRLANMTEAIGTINWVIERSDFHNRMEEERIVPIRRAVNIDVLIERLCKADVKHQPVAIKGDILGTRQTDPELLEVLLANLIDNAHKYTSTPDAITVTRIKAHTDGVNVWGVVISNPVNAEFAPDPDRIFDRYYRHELAERKAGRGLGLHLSRRIAELLDGELTYRNRDGHAVFRLMIREHEH